MAASPEVVEAATRVYGATVARIGAATGTVAAEEFRRLGSWHRSEVARWRRMLVVLMDAAGQQAAAAAAAYISTVTEAPPAAVLTAPSFARLVEPEAPFLRLWSRLAAGDDLPAALDAGASAAQEIATQGTQRAARHSVGQLAPDDTLGWRRVLIGPTCEWCALVSTQVYDTQESATFGHTRCNCSVAPIVGDVDPGRVINEDLYKAMRRDRVADRVYENRKATDLRKRAQQAGERRDAALAEAATERNPARRERLEARALDWDAKASRYNANAAEAAARPRSEKPDGWTGYVNPDGTPADRP